jgi:hypothetical protein
LVLTISAFPAQKKVSLFNIKKTKSLQTGGVNFVRPLLDEVLLINIAAAVKATPKISRKWATSENVQNSFSTPLCSTYY